MFQINGIVNKKRLDLSFYFSYCNEVFKLNKKNYVCKFYLTWTLVCFLLYSHANQISQIKDIGAWIGSPPHVPSAFIPNANVVGLVDVL